MVNFITESLQKGLLHCQTHASNIVGTVVCWYTTTLGTVPVNTAECASLKLWVLKESGVQCVGVWSKYHVLGICTND